MIYDRPYMREAQPASNSLIKTLLVANIAVFVFQVILGKHFPTGIFALQNDTWWRQPWTILTYSFLHTPVGFPWHILFNMLMLYFFGKALEQSLNTKQLATLYFGSVVAGAILWIATNATQQFPVRLIGASAGTVGFLIYFCILRANQPITFLLFFVLPVTLKPKWIAWFTFLFALYFFFTAELPGRATTESVAHSAHLGGMLGAVLFYRFAMGYKFTFSGFGNLATPFGKTNSASAPRKNRPVQPSNYTVNTKASRDHLQKEVDRILDKINEHGFGSLTQQEKRTLDQAKDVLKR